MRILSIALLILLASLISISGDVRNFYEAERSVTVAVVSEDQEMIKLIPSSPYAFIGKDGKLRVEVTDENPNYPGYGSGIAPDTLHAFDCVFQVQNDLWTNQSVVFRINSSSPNLLLYSDKSDVANSPDSATQELAFLLKWKEVACVGMVFNVSGESVGAMINVTI